MTYEDRIERAVALFKSGYNCSQAVVAAFADLYGFTDEQAFKMAASFGGGIGRMRQTCGAACGLFLVAGLETGQTYIQPEEPKQPAPAQPAQKKAADNPPPGKGMSAEQMKAYQEFVRQHPEFADAMQYDSAFTGMESMSADTVNPALRPGWYHNH